MWGDTGDTMGTPRGEGTLGEAWGDVGTLGGHWGDTGRILGAMGTPWGHWGATGVMGGPWGHRGVTGPPREPTAYGEPKQGAWPSQRGRVPEEGAWSDERGRGQGAGPTLVCSLASCFSSRLVCLYTRVLYRNWGAGSARDTPPRQGHAPKKGHAPRKATPPPIHPMLRPQAPPTPRSAPPRRRPRP